MLREIGPIRQIQDEPSRRWFEDEDLDLIVWYAEGREIHGFQLCYQKSSDEHALTWIEGKGYDHHRVDTGEQSVWGTMSPVLKTAGVFPREQVIESFVERSPGLESQLVQYVLQKIESYG